MESELVLRLSWFLGVFAAMALWEILGPSRALIVSKALRWQRNVALTVIDAAVVRVVLPAGAVGTAWLAAERGWGALLLIDLPAGVEWALTILALDAAVYLQHVLFHALPVLWRLHRVHHADVDVDVTTGLRFHPIEILISMVFKMAVVAALGAPVSAVVVFEVLLNATSLFNHANVRIPPGLDRWLRLLIVTPDMHRIHHSVDVAESNRNFGFNLPWWDRLLGTYLAEPAEGRQQMRLGLADVGRRERQTLVWLLTVPFRAVRQQENEREPVDPE